MSGQLINQPVLNEQSLRNDMVRIAASLFQRGYATGSSGNLSLQLPDGNLLATPTGSNFGCLDASRLAKVSLTGEWLSGDKPSKEIPFHLALYQHNPACKAVVHLHSTWCTALSCLQNLDRHNVIRPFTPYVVMRMGQIPLVPYFRPGDQRIADHLAALAAQHQAFLLANHGPVVCGCSLQEAANNAEELEETAKLIFILADHPVRYLTDDEIIQLRR